MLFRFKSYKFWSFIVRSKEFIFSLCYWVPYSKDLLIYFYYFFRCFNSSDSL